MKKFILSFSLASLTLIMVAQQDPQFTMWQYDKLSFNPSSAGMDRMHCISIFHRDQWDALDHDPKTYMGNYSGMFGAKQNLGIGATFYTEVLGQQQNSILRFSGAYHLGLSNNNFLSAGLSVGLIQSKLGSNWVYIDAGDPTIPTSETSEGAADIGLGLTLYQPKKYYLGISSTHLNAADLQQLNIKIARHYYIMGGYEYPINSNLSLRPNVLIKTDFAATQFDVNADVLWNNMLWAGVAFRPSDAICPYVGFQKMFPASSHGTNVLNHGIKVGYSYDVTTSEIKDYSNGSHEIFLTYCFSLSEIPMRARHSNPRFL